MFFLALYLTGPGALCGQARLSEIMTDPLGSEHHDEFVELYNASQTDTVDLAGWYLGDGDEIDRIIALRHGTALAPGGFALVLDGSYADASTTYDSVRESVTIVTIEDRAFGRSGWSNSAHEQVILVDAAGDTADMFSYDPGASRAGHSWERGTDSQWQLSLWIGGTPGQQNSVDLAPAVTGRIVIDRAPDPFVESLQIVCHLPFAPALLSVTVYDAEGNLVLRLRDWEPVAFEETIHWDGRTASGQLCPPGLYILSARASAEGRIVDEKVTVSRQ